MCDQPLIHVPSDPSQPSVQETTVKSWINSPAPDAAGVRAGLVQGLAVPLPFQIGVSAADTMAKLAAGETVPPKVTAALGICTKETADTCTAH